MNTIVICGALIALAVGTPGAWAAEKIELPESVLTEPGKKLEAQYADRLEKLGAELSARIPQKDQAQGETLNQFLASEALDAPFAEYVVLREATPRGLAAFAQQGREQWTLVDQLLADD